MSTLHCQQTEAQRKLEHCTIPQHRMRHAQVRAFLASELFMIQQTQEGALRVNMWAAHAPGLSAAPFLFQGFWRTLCYTGNN